MTVLDVRTATQTIFNALRDTLSLAFERRYPEALDIAALKAVDASTIPDRGLLFVRSEGVVYRWSMASTQPEVLPYCVAPAVAISEIGNGRWLAQSTSVTYGPNKYRPLHRERGGYYNTVQAWQGADDEALERIRAQRPALLIKWLSDAGDLKGYAHGTIYETRYTFLLHVIASNLRDDESAVLGSTVETDSEITPAPGLLRMLGDLRYMLSGSQIGLEPGVMFIDASGEATIVDEDYAQRLFAAELEIVVRASVQIVDEDLETDPEIWIERFDTGTVNSESFDPRNYVASGYRFAPQTGLSAAPTEGAAFIGGQLVTSIPSVVTLPDNAVIFRDLLPTGQLVYRALSIAEYSANGEPPVTTGAMRIGVTRTEAGNIAQDQYLGSFRVRSGANPGDPFKV